MQDTMADVHDSLIGQHQALPCRSGKGQRLGVTDTGNNESITRMQRVTIVDTYEAPGKTRALILQEQLSIIAIDTQVTTEEAYELYDRVSLPKWHSRHHSTTQQPTVTTHNMTLNAYNNYHLTKYPANNDSCLLHLRVAGVQPYTLTKLNYDSRTGKCDTTQSEAIELLPYQTFDIIMPLPSRMLIPYITHGPSRVTVVGSVTYAGGRETQQLPQAEQHKLQKQHKQPTNPSQLHPSPPRPNTLSQYEPNAPPELPAFPILQMRHSKPSTHATQERQTNQEYSTPESPTLPFTIKENHNATPCEQQQAANTEQEQESASPVPATEQHQQPSSTALQIDSDDEHGSDHEMSEQSEQDVEMEPAEPAASAPDNPAPKLTQSTYGAG